MKNSLATLMLAIGFLGSFSFANADTVLYSQTNAASSMSSVQTAYFFVHQTLGSGLSGIVKSISLQFTLASTSNSQSFICFSWTGSGCYYSYPIGGMGPGSYEISIPVNDFVLDGSSRSFYVALGRLDASLYTDNNLKWKGSSSNTYAGGSAGTDSGGSVSPLADLYFVINGEGPNTQTAITSLNSPADGQVTASNVVDFSFSYYNLFSDGFTTAGISIVDVTASQSIDGGSTSIISSGSVIQTFKKYLVSGHQYRWSAYLSKSNGQRITSQTRTFYAASTPSFSSSTASLLPIDQITDSNATSTIAQNLMQSVNIFSLVQDRVPFAYMFLIAGMINTNEMPATATAGELAIDWPALIPTNPLFNPGRVVYLSTTTVTTYFSPTALALWVAFVQVTLYVSTALVIWRMRKQLFV